MINGYSSVVVRVGWSGIVGSIIDRLLDGGIWCPGSWKSMDLENSKILKI